MLHPFAGFPCGSWPHRARPGPLALPAAGDSDETFGAATKRYRPAAVTGLSARSSAEILMLIVFGRVRGSTTVHRVVLVHRAATPTDPACALSAPAMGRNPDPVTVT